MGLDKFKDSDIKIREQCHEITRNIQWIEHKAGRCQFVGLPP